MAGGDEEELRHSVGVLAATHFRLHLVQRLSSSLIRGDGRSNRLGKEMIYY